jgi:hypothetical protein
MQNDYLFALALCIPQAAYQLFEIEGWKNSQIDAMTHTDEKSPTRDSW